MKNYKEYSDLKLINIHKRLNEDFKKEKAIEGEEPSIVTKTYKMCIDKIETELKSRESITTQICIKKKIWERAKKSTEIIEQQQKK